VLLMGRSKTPVVPLRLNLSKQEKEDLVLFLRALQGDPADPIISDPARLTAGSLR
jgi:cytochrome c peroxidase